MFGSVISSPRDALTPFKVLELANVYLQSALRTNDPDIALVLCHDAEVSLSQVKRVAKKAISHPVHVEGQTLRKEIGAAYIGLGQILKSQGHQGWAEAFYKNAEKLGVNVQENQGQLVPCIGSIVDVNPPMNISDPAMDQQIQLVPSIDPTTVVHLPKGILDQNANTEAVQLLPHSSQGQNKQYRDIAKLPQNIFAKNVHPPVIEFKLPEADERLNNITQLVCCLSLLKSFQSTDDILEPAARKWLQVIENDSDEQDRLKLLATDVIRAFKRDELKDDKAVAEVVNLAPVLNREDFRTVLKELCSGVNQSMLLDVHQLEGLAQLIQGADPHYLDADDLVKILELLNTRLRGTHHQSPKHMYKLTMVVSRVLDAMADTKVKDLDREKLHQPLSSYLSEIKSSSDPYLVYQTAYAYQALLYVPDNETLWQGTIRRTGKVIQGVSGLVSAVKGLDLIGFIEGLKDIQQGFEGVSKTFEVAKTAYEGVSTVAKSGQGFLDCLKEGFSFNHKLSWYPALRGADALIREGQFAKFKKL
ncbi:hypothetical protein BGZ65_003620, partial [Modicella reniformis]